MPRLSDTQAVLLSTAAQRGDASLLPPPDTIGAINDKIRKAVGSLIARGMAEERDEIVTARAWRVDEDRKFGAVITDAGRAAINIEACTRLPETGGSESGTVPGIPAARSTKASLILSLLKRNEGATLPELIEATDWLPHTTRAALTGLRKKGHVIARDKRGDVTCYHIAVAA